MIDRDDLRAAVNAGVLSSEQATRLEAFLVNRAKSGDEGAGESENLRFLANFNDIFITIGLLILFGGLSALLGALVGPNLESSGAPFLIGSIMVLIIGSVAWGLMEYFCARRRMLLPSMFLAIIVTLCGTLIGLLFAVKFLAGDTATLEDLSLLEGVRTGGRIGIASFVGGFLGSLAIFRRFGLPFSLALMAIAAAGTVYTFIFAFGDMMDLWSGMAVFLMGLATLAVAILYDMRDPERVTRASDNAFWLHLAAAPQVIYGLQGVITGSAFDRGSGMEAIIILIALIALAILSLALNRRALIAASLITFIYTLSIVFSEQGVDGLTTFITVSLIIGGGVVFIGAGWKTARRAVLKFFPSRGVWGRLFPPEPA